MVLLLPQLIPCHYSRWSHCHVPCFIFISNTSTVSNVRNEWDCDAHTHIVQFTQCSSHTNVRFPRSFHTLCDISIKNGPFFIRLKNGLVFLRSLLDVLCLNVLRSHIYIFLFFFCSGHFKCVTPRTSRIYCVLNDSVESLFIFRFHFDVNF